MMSYASVVTDNSGSILSSMHLQVSCCVISENKLSADFVCSIYMSCHHWHIYVPAVDQWGKYMIMFKYGKFTLYP